LWLKCWDKLCIFQNDISKLNKKVFEAEKGVAYLLRIKIKNNTLTNIKVNEKAVWVDNNGIELSVEGADASSIYLGENVRRVNSVRLKDLLDNEN